MSKKKGEPTPRGPERRKPHVPEDCALFKTGDCTYPLIGMEGCYFSPFFEQYKAAHDQSAELFRAAMVESTQLLRDSVTKLFREIEGNGEDGIKVDVARLQTDGQALHRERKIMISLLAGILSLGVLVGGGILGIMYSQVEATASLENKISTYMAEEATK